MAKACLRSTILAVIPIFENLKGLKIIIKNHKMILQKKYDISLMIPVGLQVVLPVSYHVRSTGEDSIP